MTNLDPTHEIHTLSAGICFVDLQFLGRSRVIASAILHGGGSVAIVDPGPTTTLPVLLARLESLGIGLADVTALLVTHIHLDHAGAVGTILQRNPAIRVYVHERGAPHLIDPSKLLASATRLYGNDMERLWGEVRPVPADAVTTLAGGERLTLGGRSLEVAYTPGHASHHVSYFNEDSGIAFVGDTAGVRSVPQGFPLPPTPPPDIDLELWEESLKTIERWHPRTLFLTHFGPFSSVGQHLSELREYLGLVQRLAISSLAMPGEDADRERWFVDEVRRELRRRLGETDASSYEIAGRFDLNWRGLTRYLRKKNA